ncbi:replication initiator protein A [Gluconacetobacter entanii]|uniref:Replication initiator protein A n=3 Tax=Acetobacteraceae TaxID=433 RepID=A0ABT3K4G3_9PROT|nr:MULTISPECIES: replication initiator protein A [Acetobacteraceae]EGG78581.1 Putative replication protein [Gluconacetobacter sp. SXCC-1]MBS0963664.1 replication initiator protein A [Acetobacter persici]MBV0888896.1 replication initiator protein A [Komagataeibacter oboediens]MBV1831157.1 replication initiator protein A [Komagataeibacter melomenusus]MCW4589972.1 replication initiator protein A [Gluconacetobacter entanii]
MMPAADSWRQPDRRFVVTGAARPRDVRDLMGRPFFPLGKTPRVIPVDYEARHASVTVSAPDGSGMATIWDADVLLWLTGQIVDALNHDLWVSRHVRFTPWRLFQDLGWATGANEYRRLHGALGRLAATTVATNIRNGADWREKPFTWISDVRISREDGVALTLADWLMEAACDRSRVLSVDPAYFRLGGGLERWLYRLARRHAGRQKEGWCFDLADLHARSGSLTRRRDFAAKIRAIALARTVPGYTFRVISGGKLGVLCAAPTSQSTGTVDNDVKPVVGPAAHHIVGPLADSSSDHWRKTAQPIGFEGGIGLLTYITYIITYYVGDSGLSDTFPIAPVRREKEAREAVADRMVGVP